MDFPRGTILIRRSVDTRHAGVRWGSTKTGEDRTVRLPSGDLETLQRHRVLQLRERMAASRWKDERLVFPNQSGGVMRHNQRRREFKRHLREADLSPFRMHDCRHTAITLQLQAGIPVPTVSQIAGHKNPVEALRRYSHVLQDHQQAAARIMDQMDF